ncbi:hypothetical protein SDRG_02627 [Saprolegnia diclina VS20]|uniref:RanBP2-type domain-containing protein n=1 Tax=Saprolegnia diclina (strain VS20) TaxID=1156394 RepID=T0SB86_SAPDV|nr:hypothetical protein SDRG_02627 [Saprolegnia diclina VS20]EQC39972.1 hypothetical protein SDRG_02627 [Saprolegnia diclina VS20]|eukprot:XP_008606446.1 hypothetical protein SDRG_02627 [Saprolegnia diclina VS20]
MHHRPTRGGTGWDCKAENAKAAGLYYEIANVGKMVEASKKRITWRIKMEEGKEYEISLTHSIASGKKNLRIDGIVMYQTSTFSLGDWDYVFNLGNHVLHCIIKPSVELNDSYDLIVDGVSFRRLPEQLKTKNDKDVKRGSTTAKPLQPRPKSRESSASDLSRTGSGNAWECTTCTLVNEKGLAPICEACGSPRPRQTLAKTPSFEYSKQSSAKDLREPAPRTSEFRPFDAPPAKATPDGFGVDMTKNDPFAVANAGFNQQQQQQRTGSSEQIASMLQGLDFSYTPPPPPPPTPVQPPMSDAPPVTPSDPLWGANIVSLDLVEKPKLKTTVSMQTLEQARLAKPKEAPQPVMPPPMQAPPTYTQAPMYPPASMGYGNPPGAYPGQHIVAAQPYGGMYTNTNGPMGVQRQPTAHTFMPNMTNVPPPKAAPGHAANDPFATLS